MNSETLKGQAQELDGKIKETVGEALDVDQLKAEGKAAKERGKATAKAGHLADDFEKHPEDGTIRR